MKIFFMLCAAITVQWVVENWLSYRQYSWQIGEGVPDYTLSFPNIQTFALLQTNPDLTITECEIIQVALSSQEVKRLRTK